MSVLAHPGPISFPSPRRRHLALVPALPDATPEPERLADVVPLPAALPVAPLPANPRPASRSAAAAPAPLRLTTRGRAVLAGLAIAAAAIAGSVIGAVAGQHEPTGAVDVVTVSSGDSLWSIAASVATPGEDVRDLMSEIAELNGLTGTTIVAGQQLTVPSGD